MWTSTFENQKCVKYLFTLWNTGDRTLISLCWRRVWQCPWSIIMNMSPHVQQDNIRQRNSKPRSVRHVALCIFSFWKLFTGIQLLKLACFVMTLVFLLRGVKNKSGYWRNLISWFQNSESFVITGGILGTNIVVHINYSFSKNALVKAWSALY